MDPVSDPIRARLNSMLFPHPQPPGCGELLAALGAVLDLCDSTYRPAPSGWDPGVTGRADLDPNAIRAAIAVALGVEPATAGRVLRGGVPFGTTNGEPG